MVKPKTAVKKILIVDDNREMREMTRFFLGDLPFEFEECEDGEEAIDCYERMLPDWVLMDWKMPRMDGLKATKKIIEKHPQAKIILITQHDDAQLRRAAVEAGATAFFLKDNLLALREFLNGSEIFI